MPRAINVISTSSEPSSRIDRDMPPASSGWRLEDVDFAAIDRRLGDEDDSVLLMLVASSFVESGTHLYASNLVAHFEGDKEVTTWLADQWEYEELQHGRALRTYVAHAWPAFGWERAYAAFIKDYRPLCTMNKLEAKRGLEMAARCIVETGTTSLYRAIHDHVHEPVLRTLVRRISEDEIGHYKHFLRYFRKYQKEERSSCAAVFGALIRRSIEIGREDTDYGLRFAYAERYRNAIAKHPTFDEIKFAINVILRTSVPIELAGAMWLRPLQLDPRVERQIRRVLQMAARMSVKSQ